MLLHIMAVGKIGRSPEAELVERYAARCGGALKVSELAEPAAGKPVAFPLASLSPSRTVVLDERGKSVSSRDFAGKLGGWRDDGVREVRLLIGGADGHDGSVRAGADLLLGLGRQTWPHMLARAMLAEQCYRALSILANHPYHRD